MSPSSMQLQPMSHHSSGGLVSWFDQLYLEIWLMAEFVHSMLLIKTKGRKALISTVSRDGAWRLTSDQPVAMDLSGELDSWLVTITRHALTTLLGYCGTVPLLGRPLPCACHAVT